MNKARKFQKNIYFCFIDYAKAFDCVDHNKLWKILKEMGIPDYLTCLLRNLYAGQEATVRTGHGTADWFKIWKAVCQGCMLSLCLFNLHAEYIIGNARLGETQAGQLLKRWEYKASLLFPEKPVCRPKSHSHNQNWSNRLVQNWGRSTARLYIVTLFI